jgi:phenylacetate-CoA ligase
MPFGELGFDLQDAIVLRRLQQMTNTVMLNPLWREHLERAGLTDGPRDFEEWQQVPLTDKKTMSEFFMGNRPGLVGPLSHGGFQIVASGGTSSGAPVETVYSLRELQDTYRIAGEFIGQHVLREPLAGNAPKWVMTTLADYQMWSSGTMVGGVLQNIPGINYIGAGPVRKEVYQHIMSYQGPKTIMAISQGIALLSDFGADMPLEARNSFRVALYGSGVLSQRHRLELKNVYPNLQIMSYFAATQAETIGLQLSPESYLTAVPGLHLIEIVDEFGRWVAEGEEGELVITRLHAHEAPLLRLKLGDRMIRRMPLVGPQLKAQQFEFAGRSGDVIHLCDTQYAAPQVYASLRDALKQAHVCDLDALAHEFQFLNQRSMKTLGLIAAVDHAEAVSARVQLMLGVEGVQRIFNESLLRSLSIFNLGEANIQYLQRTGYRYDIRFVSIRSDEIRRTELGKVPLIRDVL